MDTKKDNKMDTKSGKDFVPNLDIKAKIRDLEIFFKKDDADCGSGLDIDEFSTAMRLIYPTYTDEELTALHMQIDTNCNSTVDFRELSDFELGKISSRQKMDFDRQIFPLPMKTVQVGYFNKIVQITARLIDTKTEADNVPDQGQLRKYKEEEYLSITPDGVVNFWTKNFDERRVGSVYIKKDSLPFSHKHPVRVHDMVYIKEREEIAIASSERELQFYSWSTTMNMKYSIVTEEGGVMALNYWSDGKKAIFSFGDAKGFLYVFISYAIKEHGLINANAFERTKLEQYDRVYVSTLLNNLSKDHLVVQMQMFDEGCSLIKFIPSLEEFVVCGESSTKMVLAALPKSATDKPVRKQFRNKYSEKIFTSVAYCLETQELVTGGEDGILRTWLSFKTDVCEVQLKGHNKPINYLLHNPNEKVVICVHEDLVICVWSLELRQCFQTINAGGLGPNRVSGAYYSLQNNELVLANTKIGTFLGKGTDAFKNMLTSHPKPPCGAIYHNIFKQAVAVCQDGLVTIWDVNTGKKLMQFNVNPYKLMASTAIALTESKCKLITVSNDGKVRLWNFNNGQELEVIPVTVPTVVTGIICTEKKVFLSGKHSCIIYNLDLTGKGPIYLEHPFMEGGVSSIAMHPDEGKIITACKNGVVIIWDAETYDALYYIDGKKSPKTQQIFKKESMGKTGHLPMENSTYTIQEYEKVPVPNELLNTKRNVLPQSEVFNSPLILCLKTRVVDVDRATLLIAEGQYVCAWSIKAKGGLLAKFSAINKNHAEIISIETDVMDHILIVGDNKGFIYVWDIQTYGDRKQDFEGPFEEISNWKVCVRPPTLLNMWEAHNGPVMSVTCNPSCENFITTGWDCNVHLWTNKQHRVGTFGKDQWESNQLNPSWKPPAKQTLGSYTGKLSSQSPYFWPEEKVKNKSRIHSKSFKSLVEKYVYVKELELVLKERPIEQSEKALPKKEVKVERPPHKVRHKVRHLERKQLLYETPLLYNIPCPLTGPVSSEHLTEYGAKAGHMQIKLKPAKAPWTKEDSQAVSESKLSDESTLSNQHLPRDLDECFKADQDIYRDKNGTELKELAQKRSDMPIPEDDTGNGPQSDPAPPSAEKMYPATIPQRFREFSEWREKVYQDPEKQLFEVKDGAQPNIASESTTKNSSLPIKVDRTPFSPRDKKGYSSISQARARAIYGQTLNKKSKPRPGKSSLPSAVDGSKLSDKGSSFSPTPPLDKKGHTGTKESILSIKQGLLHPILTSAKPRLALWSKLEEPRTSRTSLPLIVTSSKPKKDLPSSAVNSPSKPGDRGKTSLPATKESIPSIKPGLLPPILTSAKPRLALRTKLEEPRTSHTSLPLIVASLKPQQDLSFSARNSPSKPGDRGKTPLPATKESVPSIKVALLLPIQTSTKLHLAPQPKLRQPRTSHTSLPATKESIPSVKAALLPPILTSTKVHLAPQPKLKETWTSHP